MSLNVTGAVWHHSEQSGASLLILMAIADHASPEGEAYPSIATLAAMARITERHASRLIQDLVESGELSVKPNAAPHGCNLYRVNIENLGAKPNIKSEIRKAWETRKASKKTPDICADSKRPPTFEKRPPTFVTKTPDTGVTQTVKEPSLLEPSQTDDLKLEIDSSKSKAAVLLEQSLILYAAYPKKAARPKAFKAIAEALKKASFLELSEGVRKYAESKKTTDPRYICNPATWFNEERWNDDLIFTSTAHRRPEDAVPHTAVNSEFGW